MSECGDWATRGARRARLVVLGSTREFAPALDALRDGYEVFPVVDTVGGTSPEAHRAGLERIVQAVGTNSATPA